jgi:ATP-dependent protease ClpP protease subunit
VADPQVLAAQPKTVYVIFSAEINAHTTESLLAAMAKCVNEKVQEVCLLFSTPGGLVMQGMTLYNVLRSMPFKLTTHNVGNVDSIGNVIFLAGENRYACRHSTFMFHGVGFDGATAGRLEEKVLREKLDGVLSDQGRIGSLITERTKLTKADVEVFFRDAQTKDATFAASCGIIDEIRDVQIPTGSTVVSLVFQR